MISCPKCGKENQDHYKFCLGCGNELPRESGGGARAFHPTPPAGVPAVGMGGAGAGAAMRAPTGPGFVAGAPAPNPFAAPPAQGGMSSGSFGGGGAPAPNPFGGGSAQANPFGAPSSPGGAPAAANKPPTPATAMPSSSGAAAAPSGVPAVCPSCGSPNPRGNRFCITCGSDVLALAGTPAVGSPAVPVAAAVNPFAPPSAPASTPFAPPSNAGAPAPLNSSNGGGAPVPIAAPPPPPPVPVAGAVASRARLVLIRPDGSEGGTFQLNEGTTVIGRETGPLFASDTFLSPRHATFTVNGSTVGVRDEGALNGVYVRIERQAPVEIRDTDVFRIGQEILRYEAYKPVGGETDGTERQGSQIEGLVGRISLVVGRDVTGNAFPIPITGLFLGRERGDILFPEDGYVSGLHCQLSVENGRLMLTDTGSSNGTYVRIRGERTIRNNDLLLLGQQLFRLTM